MKVYGYEISAEVEAACLERMKAKEFKAAHIAAAARRTDDNLCLPAEAGIADRIADRLIQRERQGKRIKKADKYPYWVWCGA